MAQHSSRDNLPDASSRFLYRWGVAACRHRIAILVAPVLVVLACLPLLSSVEDRLSSGGWLPSGSESAGVGDVLDEQFGRHSTAHYLLFSDPAGTLLATDTLFRREVERTVAPLRNDPSVTAIYTWGTASNPALQPLLISDDNRQSLAIVMVDQDFKASAANVPELRKLLVSDVIDVQIGGWPAATEDFRDLTSSDLRRAELFSLPMTLVVLTVVFGGVLVAGLPLVTTALALIPTLAVVAVMSRYLETSVFTINAVVMTGLAIGIDYALILVSRYREELANHEPSHAMGLTLATAGRTIIVSGMAVAIGLLGLLTFGVDAATSTAIAASIVVFLGVLISLTVLPAALSLLGTRVKGRCIDRVRVGGAIANRSSRFATKARAVLDRNPLPALLGSCAVLLLLAAPVLDIRPEPPGMTVLPQSQPARQIYDTVQVNFSSSTLSPIMLIAEPRNGRPMTHSRNLEDLEAFTEALGEIEGVDSVVSVLSFLPSGFGSGFLAGGIRVDEELAAVVQPYLTANAAVIEVNVHADPGSGTAKATLDTIRTEHPRLSDGAFTVMAGGETATSVDLIDHLTDRLPWTLGFVTLASAIILYVQFRSVLLPVKAVLLNMLSLTASFGALVWIFQEGHLAGILGFEPLGYTIVIVPILMFCFMFGLSMDYEVIMLSRIREAWLKTGDNRVAVSRGLEGSARIVTSAALIMLIVFASFGTSRFQVIQQIGLGLAIAVFVDATIIRLVALPAAMQLMGRWNWWSPSLRKRGVAPGAPAPEAPARLP
ncbi:MAG: MMPL family transporter [Chloroflexia bacterium]|nr:MMPL family transporter [Chloroflexia bacterium]